MKFKTVREGEQALVYNHLGQSELIVGPQRVFLYRKRFEQLVKFTAEPNEYLVLKTLDGTIKHKKGPCEVFSNPQVYERVYKQKATKVDSNHIVIVYKRQKEGGVDRRIIQGPCLFVPQAEEWLHEFKWHGSDPENKARLIAKGSVFSQLQNIPGHFYYDVREVRTIDDTMIIVKLMLFYELEDIIKMLESSHDPIADMMNAVCSDVIAFAGKLNFEQFVNQTASLSDLKSYSQLLQRAEKIGFNIQKVVFRGYHSSDRLQEMQNNAIESRTKLRLDGEIQQQEQLLIDFKLKKQQSRSHLKNEIDKMRQDHKHKLDALKQSHEQKLRELKTVQNIQLESENTRAKIEMKDLEDKQEIQYLSSLHSLNVNLTQILSSQPIKEEIRILHPPGSHLGKSPRKNSPPIVSDL
ncbi:hypothetical protein LOTGIDRAFT_238660 [Lottia gigantea]|uniref:Band 7 domain-containing protein n=1 Tax=Lottia gigantea TaxID=225164 RepID=V4A8C4_LOTGI|nr:hypothetical protein LOTGIDRAFT_238660 [Lottia gigantea]ESP00219.1 hypothetical protein LOTGIDRAFT_238660 [Lottia gigantea]